MQKQTKLRELVGEVREEEEPAGEDIGEPSGEVMENSLGKSLFSPFPFFVSNFNYYYDHVLFAWNKFLAYLCLPCPQMSQMKKRRVGR